MKGIPINVGGREYPICYHIAQRITLHQGSGWQTKNLPEIERLKGKQIIGAFVLRQSDGTKKKFWVNGNQLLATEAAQNAYLTYKKKGCPLTEKIPVEQLLYDSNDGPGKYAQVIHSAVDMKESVLHFESSCLAQAQEDLVIHYIYIDDQNCEYIKPC